MYNGVVNKNCVDVVVLGYWFVWCWLLSLNGNENWNRVVPIWIEEDKIKL